MRQLSGLRCLSVRHITRLFLRFFSLFYLNLEFFGLVEEHLIVVGLLNGRHFGLLIRFFGVDTLFGQVKRLGEDDVGSLEKLF